MPTVIELKPPVPGKDHTVYMTASGEFGAVPTRLKSREVLWTELYSQTYNAVDGLCCRSCEAMNKQGHEYHCMHPLEVVGYKTVIPGTPCAIHARLVAQDLKDTERGCQ